MTPEQTTEYLHVAMPVARFMEVKVLRCLPDFEIEAPLAPNLNHRQTAFGGSISNLATLSAWGWLFSALKDIELSPRLVISENSVKYLEPVSEPFRSLTRQPEPADWEKFLRTLNRRGSARLILRSEVTSNQNLCATFEGYFVALMHHS